MVTKDEKQSTRDFYTAKALAKRVPGHVVDGFVRYIVDRIPPGGFCLAVLRNDLKEAFARADEHNRRSMFEIVNFLYNDVPSVCWGSYENVAEWLEAGKRARRATDAEE